MSESKLSYRLGLDVGSGSIGWCMLRLDGQRRPCAVIRAGVRIFSDGRSPKDESSLAVDRRKARQMRRRRDRLLKRKARLIQALVELGFWPDDPEPRRKLADLDPYTLRAEGLDRKLTREEFGRAIFHLNQRRGFLSNRKADRQNEERGLLRSAIASLRQKLQESGARTLGEWLCRRKRQGLGTRARLNVASAKARGYDFYYDRAMVREEFEALWQSQKRFDPEFYTEERRTRLLDIVFFQRRLRPVLPGRCTFLPDEPRAPLALPSAQRFRILQELNHLRWQDEQMRENPLTLEQRNKLAEELERRHLTFDRIRRLLHLPEGARFNLEGEKREKLVGNLVSIRLAGEDCFGKRWHDLDEARQDEIVERLIEEEDEGKLLDWLQRELGLSEQQARRTIDAALPEGYAALSKKALSLLLPALRRDVVTYSQAVSDAGLVSHSALSHAERAESLLPLLPYYGEVLERHVAFGTGNPQDPPEKRWGRIANPTVHIALNELRKIINALIERYGRPAEIVVELARELKKSPRQRREEDRRQAERQEENKRFREQIAEILGKPKENVSAADVEKMRLWVELNPKDPTDRCCPYTGERISIERLFSPEVEVEHILPFSRTLDDSLNNKTVCLRRANRDKAERTPHEAFGHSPPGYDYEAILRRAAKMPKDKAKRFAPDAYERWLREDADFLARQLNDTAYIARLAREYLTAICGRERVWVTPGRLTALLRAKFGLNSILGKEGIKNRDDHRHHAIDAAVVAVTDRALLQRVATASAKAQEAGISRLIEGTIDPWEGFRRQVARAVRNVIVSYRPDHSHEGQMHDDTALGLRDEGKVAHRVMLASFEKRKKLEKTEFADPGLKAWLLKETEGCEDGAPLSKRLAELADRRGIRRVRLIENLQVIPIAEPSQPERHGIDPAGGPRPYKGYKGNSNYCLEIWLDDKARWQGSTVSTFEAYRIVRANGGGEEGLRALRNPHHAQNGRPLVMRLVRGDYVSILDGGQRKLMRVAVIKSNGQLSLHEHFEANVDRRSRPRHAERHQLHEHFEANVDRRSRDKEFKYTLKTASSLQKSGALPATVSPIGTLRIHRPKALRDARPVPRDRG